MDSAKEYKIPAAWIDRIFNRLSEIYGTKFTDLFKNPSDIELEKSKWRSGLFDLNQDDIKYVLNLCLNNEIKSPPTVIDFYQYAKKHKSVKKDVEIKKASKDVQMREMEKIRRELHGKPKDNTGESAVASVDEPLLSDESIPEWLR